MARPLKNGLDYFPHDTHPDKKLERFYLVYEAKGKSFWNTMLEEIYSEGWSLSVADPTTVTILAKKAFCTVEEWSTMLATALKMDLFDLGFYEQQQVLTSNGIKRRWEVVAQKRLRNADYYIRREAEKQASNPPENEFRTAERGAENTNSAGFHLRAKGKERKDLPSEDQIPPTPDSSKAEQPRPKGRAKSPRTMCPEEFHPSETVIAWCLEKKLPDPMKFVDSFVNYWRGRGDLMADWQATFRNYMTGPFRQDKMEERYGKNGIGGGRPQPYATAQQQKDRRLLEVARRLGGPAGSHPADDSPPLRLGAEGNPLG